MTTSATRLDEALGPLDGELGDLGVLVRRAVESRGDDFALDRAAHVRDLLGPLVDEQDHEMDIGVVGLDGMGDLLQDGRLARFGRRDDQPALAFADGRDEVHDPGRHVARVARDLEAQLVVGEKGVRLSNFGPVAGVVRRQAGDGVDLYQRRVLFVVGGRPEGPSTRSPLRSP